MIDVHCHLCDAQFEKDLDDVIIRAKNAGVIACIVCTENQTEFDRALSLSETYNNWFIPCFGVHPVQMNTLTKKNRSVLMNEIDGMRDKLAAHSERLVAIGEVGLDYTFGKTEEDKLVQHNVLKKQISMANSFNLPLNVHSRSAGGPVIDFLLKNGVKDVVLHAYSGDYESAIPAINAGYYFSVPPCSINDKLKQSVFEKVPLEQLLLETDSPVLGPHREERNEPANLVVSCQFLADLKKVDVENVQKVTTENAFRLFPKLKKFLNM